MPEVHRSDPLAMILPVEADRELWQRVDESLASDTGVVVVHYEHRRIGRTLRLDGQCRVYGQDAEGVIRLFGRGGPLALAVALNAVYDGSDEHRPHTVVLPDGGGVEHRKGAHEVRAGAGDVVTRH